VKAKLGEWLGDLRDWDISRDAPYFGFAIPGAPGKFFYVWLDAPIGYLASFRAYCDRNGVDFDSFLQAGSKAEMHHFIGKDIINFHGLFWPAMLHGAGLRTPTRLHVNGYLMVNGAKMSKSRGTFVMARTYLDAGIEPEALRYYFATRSAGGVDDLDLNLEDFVARVNSDLVGKFVNLASRASGFAAKHFDGALDRRLAPGATDRVDDALAALAPIRQHYRDNDFAAACREAMRVCDLLNQRWDEAKPWLLAKDEAKRDELQQVCSECLLGFYAVALRAVAGGCRACGGRALALFERKPDEWDALVAHAAPRTCSPTFQPAHAHRPVAGDGDGRSVEEDLSRAAMPRPAMPAATKAKPARGPCAAPGRRRPSRARTSVIEDIRARGPCAWARYWSAASWKARTSCCASSSTPVSSASGRSSPGIRAGYPEPDKLVRPQGRVHRQPGAAQDALRRVRGNDPLGRWRRRPVPARRRRRRRRRHDRQVSAVRGMAGLAAGAALLLVLPWAAVLLALRANPPARPMRETPTSLAARIEAHAAADSVHAVRLHRMQALFAGDRARRSRHRPVPARRRGRRARARRIAGARAGAR
jgi:methionyl-tRNA synthetase